MTGATSYTLRDWGGALGVLGTAAAVIVGALILGMWQDRLITNAVTSAVVAGLGVAGAARASVRLRLDGSGITMREPSATMLLPWAGRDRHLPWDSVAELEVVDGTSVTATLREEAPLPRWMHGRIWTPAAPQDRSVVRLETPGVDAAAVTSAGRLLAPEVSVR